MYILYSYLFFMLSFAYILDLDLLRGRRLSDEYLGRFNNVTPYSNTYDGMLLVFIL